MEILKDEHEKFDYIERNNLRSCSNFRTAICSLRYTHRGYRFVDLHWQRLSYLIDIRERAKQENKTKLTNDCPAKGHIPTKVYIPSYRQMIEFQNLGNLLEPLLELLDLQKKNYKNNAHLKERRKKRNKVPF